LDLTLFDFLVELLSQKPESARESTLNHSNNVFESAAGTRFSQGASFVIHNDQILGLSIKLNGRFKELSALLAV
jgi:hypothetical protein